MLVERDHFDTRVRHPRSGQAVAKQSLSITKEVEQNGEGAGGHRQQNPNRGKSRTLRHFLNIPPAWTPEHNELDRYLKFGGVLKRPRRFFYAISGQAKP